MFTELAEQMSTGLKIANLIKSTEDVIELELDTSASTISRKTKTKKKKKKQTAGQELSDYNQRAVKAAVGREKQALLERRQRSNVSARIWKTATYLS